MMPAANVFGRSRRQLTLYYSAIMGIFLVLLIFVAHKSMEWSFISEQARELTDTAMSISEAQRYAEQHPGLIFEGSQYKSSNDRLFFYVFDDDGEMINCSRASFLIEPFVLENIANWKAAAGETPVFAKPAADGPPTRIMMASCPVYTAVGFGKQTVYVGKDVTATYNGLRKATYALIALCAAALVIATAVGYAMSGRAIVPLSEAYEKQRQFAADASHELRTPLSVVMASADLLDSDPSIISPFLKQVIADVRDEVKKMNKLVGDLLIVARGDNKALQLKPQRFDLAKLIEQNVRLMQPLAEKRRQSLIISRLESTDIMADEQCLKQLLLILIDNAIKYTPEGGLITVGMRRSYRRQASFFVQDTGIGIAEDDREKIFDRFYRVDKARSRKMGGNGLGLPIAQEIAHLHNGRIRVDSEPGKGSTFTVTLPIKLSQP